jgi:hypothetical protein
VREDELVRVARVVEGTDAGDGLEEDESGRVHVRTTVDGFAPRLFGGHVARSAHGDASSRDYARIIRDFRDTEVENLGTAVI